MTAYKINILQSVMLLMLMFISQSGSAATLPAITGDVWLNSKPLKQRDLTSQVVLIYFWTFGCHNCKAVEPYVKQWHQRYADKGLTIIAIHSPEFSHERKLENVRNYIAKENIDYPVVIDNNFTNWRRFSNRYWPTIYLANKEGQLVYRKIGEGNYATTEQWIQELIAKSVPETMLNKSKF